MTKITLNHKIVISPWDSHVWSFSSLNCLLISFSNLVLLKVHWIYLHFELLYLRIWFYSGTTLNILSFYEMLSIFIEFWSNIHNSQTRESIQFFITIGSKLSIPFTFRCWIAFSMSNIDKFISRALTGSIL